MNNLFVLLILTGFILFLIGLFKPTASLFWDKNQPSKKKSALIYGGLTFLCLLILGISVAPKKTNQISSQNQTSTTITEPQKQQQEPNQAKMENEKPKFKEVENIFHNTNALVLALSQNGIGQLKKWSNPMEMGWGSLSDYYEFGNRKDGIGMMNNISYYIEGTETVAKKLTLAVNINNPAEKKSGLKFLNEITERTFKSLSLEIPSGMSEAIFKAKPFKANIKNFITYSELDKSKIETWKVIIQN